MNALEILEDVATGYGPLSGAVMGFLLKKAGAHKHPFAVGGWRDARHAAFGAGVGAAGGAGLDEQDRGRGALRGAGLGALGGLGVAQRTHPVVEKMKKEYDKKRHVLSRMTEGGRQKLEKKVLHKHRGEHWREGTLGGMVGGGLGAATGEMLTRHHKPANYHHEHDHD